MLVTSTGTAIAFVLIFCLAGDVLCGRWLLYALLGWVMFVIGEIGQAIGPNYSWTEALGGILSETIYVPLSAYATKRLAGRR